MIDMNFHNRCERLNRKRDRLEDKRERLLEEITEDAMAQAVEIEEEIDGITEELSSAVWENGHWVPE